jgi:hypothetical protein
MSAMIPNLKSLVKGQKAYTVLSSCGWFIILLPYCQDLELKIALKLCLHIIPILGKSGYSSYYCEILNL